MTDPRPPEGSPPRPIERDGRTWLQRADGGWAWWDPRLVDWVESDYGPSPEPDPVAPTPQFVDVDPWKGPTLAQSAREFFIEGPGRNLLLATAIFLSAMLAMWALARVWDPFDVAGKGVFAAFSDALPFLAFIVGTIWFVVNGFLRVGRGEPFVPPRFRRQAEAGLKAAPRAIWRATVMFLAVLAGLFFLMWWLGGYLKPFGASPIEFGSWENNPVFLVISLICAGGALLTWILGRLGGPR